VKHLAHAALAAFVLATPAQAAETAERHIQGFNSTGSVFVFEQFGEQDGSGFPYSEIFHIRTDNSANLVTPVKRVVQNETATVGLARRRARAAALSFNGFLDMGVHVFHHALNETPNTVTSATFSRDYGTTAGNVGPNYKVTVSQQTSPTPACADFTSGNEKTFSVRLENLTSGGAVDLRPAAFPPAFYNYLCPTDYSLADVVLYPRGGTTRIVALVSVLVVGFEGPDRRFIAVAGTLN
jgi:hypothetical protein